MSEPIRCENQAPHQFHAYSKLRVRECSGKTGCGISEHPSHSYNALERLWCPGICACTDPMRGLHGPGAHK